MKFSSAIISILTMCMEYHVFAKDDYKALRRRKLIAQEEGCILEEMEVQFINNDRHASKWMCELQGQDIVNAGIPAGAAIMVEIEGLEQEDLISNKAVSGVTTLKVEGAQLGNGRLMIPPGAKKQYGRLPNRRPGNGNVHGNSNGNGKYILNDNKNGSGNNHDRDRSLADTVGVTKKVVAVRIIAPDASTSTSAENLSDNIFGTEGDQVNLRSQFDACSNGSLKMEPAIGNHIEHDGIVAVKITSQVNGANSLDIANEAAVALIKMLGGIDLPTEFDHVMMCIPPGTFYLDPWTDVVIKDWISYAYLNSWLSVYNDEWCNIPHIQLHEIGHNLNLYDSNDNGKEYADQTGIMGSLIPYAVDEGPKMCFNPGKNWILGWYTDRYAIARPLDNSWTGKLIGVADYDLTTGMPQDEYTVVLRLGDGYNDYFIGFNRKTKVNSGTVEAGDLVTVVQQKPDSESHLLAKLDEGETFEISNYLESSHDVTIKVDSIHISDNDDEISYAQVVVHKDDCIPGDCIPDCGEVQCCGNNQDCLVGDSCVIGTCNVDDGTCTYDRSGCSPSTLKMEIVTDNFPWDTTWDITDDCNNGIVVMRGGPYTDENTPYVIEKDVTPSKFTVTVYDADGDGICCEEGIGSFSTTLDDNLVASGGKFGFSSSATFGSCAGSGSDCSSDQDCVDTDEACVIGTCNVDDGTCTYDRSGCSELKMAVLTDYYPQETTWTITDDCNDGDLVMSGGPYTEANKQYESDALVTPSKFTLTIFDSFGDGICCGWGIGEFSTFLDDNLVASGGVFGDSTYATFGSCDATSSGCTNDKDC